MVFVPIELEVSSLVRWVLHFKLTQLMKVNVLFFCKKLACANFSHVFNPRAPVIKLSQSGRLSGSSGNEGWWFEFDFFRCSNAAMREGRFIPRGDDVI